MTSTDTVLTSAALQSQPPALLKPLLFCVAPSEVRCESRTELLTAIVTVVCLHAAAMWSVVPLTIPPGTVVSAKAVAGLLTVQLALVAAGLVVRWALVTYFVWAMSAIRQQATTLVSAGGLVVMADVVTAVQLATVSVVARYTSIGAQSYLQAPKMGLDLFFSVDSPWLGAILSSVDVFAVWYSVLMYAGLHAGCGFSRRGAALLVVGLAVLSVAVRVIAASFAA